MAGTTLGDALDRLAEAAAEVQEMTGRGTGGTDGTDATAGTVGAALAGAVVDLEDAAGASLGPVEGEADVALLRRIDRAHRLLLAARSPRPGALQAC